MEDIKDSQNEAKKPILEDVENNQELQEPKKTNISEFLALQKQKTEQLLKELEDKQNLLNAKELEIKKIKMENKLKTLYKENGGKDEAFDDYYNKHAELLLNVEDEDLLNVVETTTELSPWAFSTNPEAVKSLDKSEVEIKVVDKDLHEGTVYEKR